MDSRRTVVTVDGLAASGKSALAQQLAERLNFVHLNTGLLYRAAGLLALREKIDPEDGERVIAVTSRHSLSLSRDSATGAAGVLLDGSPLGDELTTVAVSGAASVVGKHRKLRELLLPVQREAFPGEGLVAEGRDMGTVVFPNATIKFFVNARLEVRAERRRNQLIAKGSMVTLEEVKKDISDRDRRDSERETAPMKAAADAIEIDNSERQFKDVVVEMVRRVQARLAEK